MAVVGIIMECNPFHEGHDYIIRKAREIADAGNPSGGSGAVIAVISGDFVQRGIPAVVPKEVRTRQILEAGADLVLELPVRFATSSAETFARGAVDLLIRSGIVTDLVFGSESGNLDRLLDDARFLIQEPEDYRMLLRSGITSGLPFPAARAFAAGACSAHVHLPDSANDLLAEEYLKELLRRKSSIVPHAVRRISSASATEIRHRMKSQPDSGGVFEDDFSGLLLEKLLVVDSGLYRMVHDSSADRMDTSGEGRPVRAVRFEDYAGISPDFSNRIHRMIPEFISWTQFAVLLKSRNITSTAVNRALLHILLNVTGDLLPAGGDRSERPPVSCTRLLGFRKESAGIAGRIRENGLMTVAGHADYSEFLKRCSFGDSSPLSGRLQCNEMIRSLQLDLAASEIYDLVRRMKVMKMNMKDMESAGEKDTGKAGDRSPAPVSEFSKAPVII